ncbi:hypothetical protein [Nocardiopsis sp. NPDC006938]|uniref:hypothetical protein n=1 Tax=Nocardiopsis sp. NPDC006938 TaxID=3364337 RepID=UPI00368D0D30
MIATVHYTRNRQPGVEVYEAADAELLKDLLIQCLELDDYDMRIVNKAFSRMGPGGETFDLGKERGTRDKKRRITASVSVVGGRLTHMVSATYSVDVPGGGA